MSAEAANRVRPRQLLHRGVVAPNGWLLQGEWLDEAEVRRRALSLWEPGCQLYEVSGGLLLRITRPRTVDCAGVMALPLTESEGVLYATSLQADERATIDPPTGSVVLVQAGEAFAEPVVRRIDPADWLGLDNFELRAVEPIGAPAIPPPVIIEPTPVIDRAKLATTIGAPPDEMNDVAAALSKAARGERAGEPATASGRGESWRVRLSRWGRRARSILRSLAGSASKRSDSGARATAGAPSSFWAALRRLFARAIYWSRLGRLLGRRQAAYLAEMMDLLRRGELEGLRRAIPLDSDPLSPSSRPALGVPSRREGLEISLTRRQPAAGYALANELFGEIRTLYNAVFARLAREGRIDEAAFVLAELLRSNEEAVAFLEQHGRYRLAAELAESRDLPAGLVVRQWFLAKDIRRAIRMAEERGAYADAVARLERTHRREAQLLRMLWAERLASRGDYGSAVEVAWPITEARRLIGGWIDRAMEVGGVVAARLLVRRLQAVPTEFDAMRDRAVDLLSNSAPAGLAERRAFLTALGEAPPARELAPLARIALRAQLRDAARFGGGGGQKKVRELLMRQAADGALRADLPPLPASVPTAAVRLDIPALDRGTLAIHDVLRLPSGNLLIALGELGVRLLRPDGRVIAHFDMPAHALVGSDHGDRALTLATRGETVRVGRIDVLARRAQPWTDLRVRGFARDFDGVTWFIADETTVSAIDVEGEQPRARWRLNLVEGIPMRLTRDANNLSFAVLGSEGAELWTYELSQMVLRSRRAFDGGAPIGVAASGSLSACLKPCSENPYAADVLLASANVNAVLTNPAGLGVPVHVDIGSQWHVVVVDVGESMAVYAYKASASTPTHSIALAGARRVQVRLLDEALIVGDDLGRLIAVHTLTGSTICDLRVHI